MSCDGRPDTKVQIPMSTVMSLNIHCELSADSFKVSKLSFRRMLEHNNRVDDIADISFEAESAMLTQNPIRTSIMLLLSNQEVIAELKSANSFLNESLINLKKMGEDRWNSVLGGLDSLGASSLLGSPRHEYANSPNRGCLYSKKCMADEGRVEGKEHWRDK